MKRQLTAFITNLYKNVSATGLKKLEQRALKELELLNYPRKNWLVTRKTSKNEHIYDVAIVGAGQTGIALAFSLMREQIKNIILFDECRAGQEGPWLSYARMETLRTPKYTIGPDCDIPSLTFQAWYEAIHGEDAWMKIKFIPRIEWAAYLWWLRQFLQLPVVNEAKVGALKWLKEENCFLLPIEGKEAKKVYARKIILATGLAGSGEWTIPQHIKNNIPRPFYYQTSELINFDAVKGKKVAILGGGPCAFDNALMCCESGAQEVHLFFRKPQLVNRHVFLWGEYTGFLHSFPELPDEAKWQFIAKMVEIGQPPTPIGVEKVLAQKNIKMHFDSPWIDSMMKEGHPVVITPKAEEVMDVLIIAIGWNVDLSLRKELDEFREYIAVWADKFTPPQDQMYAGLLQSPYLAKSAHFTEKVAGTAPYLHSIFNCTGGALLSTGFNAGTGLTGMKYSVRNVVNEMVNQFFNEDKDYYYQTLNTYHDTIF